MFFVFCNRMDLTDKRWQSPTSKIKQKNQSTNQPTNQPINQPTNQTNKPTQQQQQQQQQQHNNDNNINTNNNVIISTSSHPVHPPKKKNMSFSKQNKSKAPRYKLRIPKSKTLQIHDLQLMKIAAWWLGCWGWSFGYETTLVFFFFEGGYVAGGDGWLAIMMGI